MEDLHFQEILLYTNTLSSRLLQYVSRRQYMIFYSFISRIRIYLEITDILTVYLPTLNRLMYAPLVSYNNFNTYNLCLSFICINLFHYHYILCILYCLRLCYQIFSSYLLYQLFRKLVIINSKQMSRLVHFKMKVSSFNKVIIS